MRSAAVIALSALSAMPLATAKQNFTIDVNEVDPGTKVAWCKGQYNTCIQLCGGPGEVKTDTCDDVTLEYDCTCNNGTAPGLEYYKTTIPFHICEQAFEDCTNENVGDNLKQQRCKSEIQAKCATLDPSDADPASEKSDSSSKKSSSATTTAAPSTTTGGAATTTSSGVTTSSSDGAAPTNAAVYGNGAAVAAVGLLAYLL